MCSYLAILMIGAVFLLRPAEGYGGDLREKMNKLKEQIDDIQDDLEERLNTTGKTDEGLLAELKELEDCIKDHLIKMDKEVDLVGETGGDDTTTSAAADAAETTADAAADAAETTAAAPAEGDEAAFMVEEDTVEEKEEEDDDDDVNDVDGGDDDADETTEAPEEEDEEETEGK